MFRCLAVIVCCGLVGLSTAQFRRCVDNLVKERDFRDNIAVNGVKYLTVYSIEINTEFTYAKTSSSFVNGAGTVSYNQLSYNEDSSICQEFDRQDAAVASAIRFRRDCGRFERFVYTRYDNSEVSRFVSQDTSKYFWWFICIDGTIMSFNGCDEGFFDLNIPDNREEEDGDIDLSGLPWDKIAEDLESFTGLKIDDPRVQYKWLGPQECSASDVEGA